MDLNINLGLRYDYQQPFYTHDPNTSIFDPTNGLVVASPEPGSPQYVYNSSKPNVSPRVGFSYQLHSGLVIRVNYGIYYDQPAGQTFPCEPCNTQLALRILSNRRKRESRRQR